MNIMKQIEFDKIKENWKELTATQWAKNRIDEITFILNENELRKQLRDTTNSRLLIEKLGTPPLQNVDEAREIMMAAQKGNCLTPYQLERVEKVLVVVKRLRDYLSSGKAYENPLAFYDENFDDVAELREEISRQIRNETVDDYASKELHDIRRQIVRCEEQMRQKAEQIMSSNKDSMSDSFYTKKNGRICVPVKKACKFKIPGSVIDKSSTGNTLFIEPVGVAKINEELQILLVSEENEVYRILYTLTAMVADAAPVMNQNIEMIERLDFILSKGKLSIDMDAVEPKINTERKIVLRDARHPLMDRSINIPLQFSIGENARGIIITGPNTGGKTVAIKTVMLNSIMAQCGLHVTCSEANICMNNSYLCDIGDGQNLAENLSTFSAHIKNVLEVLGEVNSDSFVIMDELGSGTDPAEGMGIAIAILEELRKSGAIFLVTTHYPEVKEYANKTQDIINARMTFDKETLRPTYQMIIGEAGESCAFYIADRLGMPNEMLRVAISAAYGEKAVETYHFQKEDSKIEKSQKRKIIKSKNLNSIKKKKELTSLYNIGDSVMIFPDKKIGIVCEPVNEKGVLRVQLRDKKIYINHTRVKLQVAADQLYPADYDFSIIFDTVEQRKAHHEMGRKHTDLVLEYNE